METTLNFRPHPAAVKLCRQEAEEAARVNRRPRFTKPEEAMDTQCLYDGDELIGYCGYKAGMGFPIVAQNIPDSFVEECVAFLTAAHGGPPKRTGRVPPLVEDSRNAPQLDDGE